MSISISLCNVLVSAFEYLLTWSGSDIFISCATVSPPRVTAPPFTLGDVLQARKAHYTQFPSRAPSEGGVPAAFGTLQTINALPFAYCNRPASASSTPVALMHPIFGKFVDECRTYVPTEKDNTFVANLSRSMSGFFADETARRDAFISLFNQYCIQLNPAEITSTKYRTDGHATESGYMYLLSEAKPELAGGTAEPYFQSVLYYRASCKVQKPGDSISVLPCFLIFYCGANQTRKCYLCLY